MHLKLGRFNLTFINSGRFKLDGGAMFSVVPKVIWEKTNPADETNRIEMAANSLLIDDGRGERILVETGCGSKNDEKTRKIYAIENTSAVEGLAEFGVSAESVTAVINTHLHFDHAGGNTQYGLDGEPAPAFPNACYYSQSAEWQWACSPSIRDAASYNPADFLPVEKAGLLVLVDGEREIIPGVKVIPTPGHNPGHQSVLIESEGATALYCTDLCPTSTHLNLPFIMSYDLEPLKIIETKKKILDLAVRGDWLMLFYHDPKVHYGRLRYGAKGRVELADGWK